MIAEENIMIISHAITTVEMKNQIYEALDIMKLIMFNR